MKVVQNKQNNKWYVVSGGERSGPFSTEKEAKEEVAALNVITKRINTKFNEILNPPDERPERTGPKLP